MVNEQTLAQAKDYTTIVQPIIERARTDPQRVSLVILQGDGSRTTVTAAELHAGSVAYALALQAYGIHQGDHVVLVMGHDLPLFYSFLGPMYIGAVPSIFPYPTPNLDLTLYFERVQQLVTHYGVRAVITEPRYLDQLASLLAGTGCQVISTDSIDATPQPEYAETGLLAEIDEHDLAFIQHTSGTTGVPKGVGLSHRAVLNHVFACAAFLHLDPEEDVCVSWLPLYHDMGLTGTILMVFATGTLSVTMSPFTWVRRPKLLFEAINEFRGSLSWMPNFAYNLSAKAVRDSDLEGMDLSCWRYLLNGSEPLLHTSHEAFIKRFGPYGFPNESLNSGYGLAENLVAVTLCPLYERAPEDTVVKSVLQEGEHAVPADETTPAEDTTTLVSSGVPIPNCEVRIVDEQGNDQPDRAIGEIIIRSDTLFEGYYERPDLTAEVFDEDGWFYTGDLGYFVEGHLYVIGREKDLIIVGGKNIYPHELEIIADSMRTLKPGRSVAFGVDDTAMGTEQIVMVCEVTDPEAVDALPEIERELRRRVTQALGVTIGDVRLVNDRWVIKTPSGKFARNDNRRKYFAEFAAE